MKHLFIKDIDETIYRLFKMKCAENGTTIKATLIKLMEEYTRRVIEIKKGK
jgi:hypothetical protein